MTSGDGLAQRAVFADQVFLTDELLERPWTHPGGQRLALGRRPEEGLGSGSREAGRGTARGHAGAPTQLP